MEREDTEEQREGKTENILTRLFTKEISLKNQTEIIGFMCVCM